jgi:hypothetical protein
MAFLGWGEDGPIIASDKQTTKLAYWGDGGPLEVIYSAAVGPAACISETTCEDIPEVVDPCVSETTCETITLPRPADSISDTTCSNLAKASPDACVSPTTCEDLRGYCGMFLVF